MNTYTINHLTSLFKFNLFKLCELFSALYVFGLLFLMNLNKYNKNFFLTVITLITSFGLVKQTESATPQGVLENYNGN